MFWRLREIWYLREKREHAECADEEGDLCQQLQEVIINRQQSPANTSLHFNIYHSFIFIFKL